MQDQERGGAARGISDLRFQISEAVSESKGSALRPRIHWGFGVASSYNADLFAASQRTRQAVGRRFELSDLRFRFSEVAPGGCLGFEIADRRERSAV